MRKIIYSISVFLTCAFFTRSAHAIWPDFTPVIPFSPQLCVMCIPPAISVAVSYVDQVKELRDDLKKYTDMTVLKQMAISYAAKMGTTAFNKWKQNKDKQRKLVSYARTIKDSNLADLTDEASVKDAFVKLFLQYPSEKARTNEAYKSLGEQLKMDTTMEMYLTALEMEKELYGKSEKQDGSDADTKNMEDLGMLRQIDLIESCLVEGKSCDEIGLTSCQEKAGSGDDDTKEDQVCFWNSALQAEKLYDTIMKYNLMLVAMHAQYQAVMGINKMAKIREFVKEKDSKKEDKSSFLFEEYFAPSVNTAAGYMTADAVFADLTPEEEEAAAKELGGYEENLMKRENIVRGNFEDANNPKSFSAAIDEKEDDVKSLLILEEIRNDLDNALRMHNMKQTLPGYKKVFEDYESAKKQMERAQKNLEESGECVMNMLKPHYDKPNMTWFGQNCAYYGSGQIACHYTPEKAAEDGSESEGLYDTICPGDDKHSCSVSELHADKMPNGIAKYLFTLYTEAKDEDAAGDTEPVAQVSQTQKEGEYTSRATITLDNDGQEIKDDDDLFVTSRSSDDSPDGNMADRMTTQTSDKGDGGNSTLKDQEKGDEEKENARKDGLIRWIIGSEVAKELALDLDTGENEWGTRKSKFPLWNDQIYFYNQYIDGKYENIEEYIRTMPYAEILLKIAKNLNPIYPYKPIAGIPPISAEQQRQDNEKALDKLEKDLKKYFKDLLDNLKKDNGILISSTDSEISFSAMEAAQINQAINEENMRFENIRTEYKETRAAKEKELKNWYNILNEANIKISEINQEYNKQHETVKRADATTPEATEGVEYSAQIYAGRTLSKDSPQNEEFNATKDGNKTDSEQAKVKMASDENNLRRYEQIVKRAEDRIAKIKEDLEKMRIMYVKKLSDAEASAGVEFNKLTEELRAGRQISLLSDAITEILPLDLADRLVQCVREYSLIQVSAAKSKIDALKPNQSLYYTETAPKVQEIHQNMIEKITNIKAEDLAECEALSELKEFNADKDENILPAINIFADACKDGFCKAEDADYFVGAIGLPRDMSAPKSPVNFSSAPVREVFHFDIIDFNNMDKYYKDKDELDSNRNVYISVETFLDFLNQYQGFEYGGKIYGSTVPEIWKYILKRHAFVQKQIDWVPLLGEQEEAEGLLIGDNRKTLLRSGVYPCVSEGNYIDVVRTNGGPMYYNSVRTATAEEEDVLPECRGISLAKNKGKTVVDDNEAGGGYTPVPDKGAAANVDGSELGTILAYIPELPTGLNALLKAKLFSGEIPMASLPHRLTFNNDLLKAISAINKTEELGTDVETDIKFYQASRVMYERNQFGDYLDQVEYESIVADSMKKIEKQISEIRDKLRDVISVGSFVMSDDFNLLNSDDYNQAAQVLDAEKKEYMDVALQKLNSLPQNAGQSQSVRDKYDKLLHTIAILQADAEEIVTLKGDEELDELEEKIKNQQADTQVEDKFNAAKKAEDERQKAHYRHPYCASY